MLEDLTHVHGMQVIVAAAVVVCCSILDDRSRYGSFDGLIMTKQAVRRKDASELQLCRYYRDWSRI